MRRGAADATRIVHAYRGKRPTFEGDHTRWVSDDEGQAAEVVVRNALELLDRALQPATPDFVELVLATMSAAFPQSKGTDQDIAMKIAVYVDALCDFPPDLLAAAARKALRRCRFFPTIAELLSGWDGDSVEDQLAERIESRNRYARALGEAALPAPRSSGGNGPEMPWLC